MACTVKIDTTNIIIASCVALFAPVTVLCIKKASRAHRDSGGTTLAAEVLDWLLILSIVAFFTYTTR